MWNLIGTVVQKVVAEVVFKMIKAVYGRFKVQKKPDVDASDE